MFSRFGEKNVRVSHLQYFEKTGQRRRFGFIERVISLVLLFAPQVYYGDLQQTYDDQLTMEDWKPFFEGVRNDWQGIVINVCSLPYDIVILTVYWYNTCRPQSCSMQILHSSPFQLYLAPIAHSVARPSRTAHLLRRMVREAHPAHLNAHKQSSR